MHLIRNRFSLPVIAALVLLLSVGTLVRSLYAQEEKQGAEKSEGDTKNADKPMNKDMELMNKALQKITRDLKNPKKLETTLAAVSDLQKYTIACKDMKPEGATTRPAAELESYLKEYRIQMADVLKATADLEQQIVRGETDKAAATVKQLRALEKKGHSVYQPPDAEK
ncbi:MAG TPA: cytochrome b562 [Tepidisphaeraceae bacterium]|jgi:hypothetical protein